MFSLPYLGIQNYFNTATLLKCAHQAIVVVMDICIMILIFPLTVSMILLFSNRFWNYYDGVTCFVIVLICFAFVNIEFLFIINVIIINTEALL